MKLSTRGEYGVRVMIDLARAYGAGPVPLASIAASEDLSLSYLEQLIAVLRREGLVESVRGARGGYSLAVPPAAVRVGDVVRALEGPIEPVSCGSPESATCARRPTCAARAVWDRLRDNMSQTLDSVTLADLIAGRADSSIAPVPQAR
jgi:Rrf2 family transcriptional regulator, cysteine metabolism repressor